MMHGPFLASPISIKHRFCLHDDIAMWINWCQVVENVQLGLFLFAGYPFLSHPSKQQKHLRIGIGDLARGGL
jgi:hypothetical protein